MGLLARRVVIANLMAEEEIPGALRWASYHGLKHSWNQDALFLMVRLQGLVDEDGHREEYLLSGVFDDYRVIPPAWRFLDPRNSADVGKAAFPTPGTFGPGSILHTNGVICAPWNRLAYATETGLHNNWTDLTKWETLEPNRTHAKSIPDMLARIRAEVGLSPRRLAPLPPVDVPQDGAA